MFYFSTERGNQGGRCSTVDAGLITLELKVGHRLY
jgi:hypothetical protein